MYLDAKGLHIYGEEVQARRRQIEATSLGGPKSVVRRAHRVSAAGRVHTMAGLAGREQAQVAADGHSCCTLPWQDTRVTEINRDDAVR